METENLYSHSPREFLSRFDKRMSEEQKNLWESEFLKYKEKDFFQFEDRDMEEILDSSDYQKDIFLKEQKSFDVFISMIPEINKSDISRVHSEVIERTINFVDYIYCLNDYYDFKDKVRANLSSLKRRYQQKLKNMKSII